MAKDYKTPGVYVEEISKFPPSVAAVETAIPAFIGYTEKARKRDDDDLRRVPHRISSMVEYEQFFGVAEFETGIKVRVTTDPITGLPLEVVPSLVHEILPGR